MKQVRIVAKSPSIDVSVDMGNGAATITSGLGGWQTVERIDDISLTDWAGQQPLQQSVPLMLDGFARARSVERELNSILKLGRDARGDENVPPVFKVFGPVYYEGKSWVLPDNGIELDAESVIREDDGTLVRQALTLHLLEFIAPDRVRLRKKRNAPKGHPEKTGGTAFPGSTYTTKKGDTLHSIAANLYGDWHEWKAIAKKNGLKDPNKKLKPGTVLRLP